jgi:hypothetical protein
MDTIFSGIEFAIGLVAGLVMIFFVVRWLRYRYYRASKLQGDDLPIDIRVHCLKVALKECERARRKGMSPEQAKEAHVNLIMAAQDKSLPWKLRDSLGREAVTMLKISCGVTENK